MSSTIFCMFEQQDLADLAMGQIRHIHGVWSIHYIGTRDYSGGILRPGSHSGIINAINTPGSMSFGAVWHSADRSQAYDLPSLPVSVRIVCADSARRRVEAALVNLHAHRITTRHQPKASHPRR